MRIVCRQTILVKSHALFVIFEKAAKFAVNYRWRSMGYLANDRSKHSLLMSADAQW